MGNLIGNPKPGGCGIGGIFGSGSGGGKLHPGRGNGSGIFNAKPSVGNVGIGGALGSGSGGGNDHPGRGNGRGNRHRLVMGHGKIVQLTEGTPAIPLGP